MPEVNLNVLTPEGAAKLDVFESANPTGPFVLVIEIDVPAEGLSDVDVTVTDADDWFAVQWKDADGAWLTALSPPFKAGETSFVDVIVDRVLQRDSSIGAAIARQEAEAAVEWFFNKNPYSVTMADIAEGQQYRTINGLTYLTMARSYVVKASSTRNVSSATLGLVSFRTETGTNQQVDVQALLDLANSELGLGTSLVLQMADICDEDFWVNVLEP